MYFKKGFEAVDSDVDLFILLHSDSRMDVEFLLHFEKYDEELYKESSYIRINNKEITYHSSIDKITSCFNLYDPEYDLLLNVSQFKSNLLNKKETFYFKNINKNITSMLIDLAAKTGVDFNGFYRDNIDNYSTIVFERSKIIGFYDLIPAGINEYFPVKDEFKNNINTNIIIESNFFKTNNCIIPYEAIYYVFNDIITLKTLDGNQNETINLKTIFSNSEILIFNENYLNFLKNKNR